MRERRLVKGAPWRTGWAGENRDFFSILLEKIADQLHRLFRRDRGMHEVGREVLE